MKKQFVIASIIALSVLYAQHALAKTPLSVGIKAYDKDPTTSVNATNLKNMLDVGEVFDSHQDIELDFTYTDGDTHKGVNVFVGGSNLSNTASIDVEPAYGSITDFSANGEGPYQPISNPEKVMTVNVGFVVQQLGSFSIKVYVTDYDDPSDQVFVLTIIGKYRHHDATDDFITAYGPPVSDPNTGNDFLANFQSDNGNKVNVWDWSAHLFHTGGSYSVSGSAYNDPDKINSTYTINGPGDVLPDYEWLRDNNGNIMGSVDLKTTDLSTKYNYNHVAMALPHKPNPVHAAVSTYCHMNNFDLKLEYYTGGAATYNVYVEILGRQRIAHSNQYVQTLMRKYITDHPFSKGSVTSTRYASDDLLSSAPTSVTTGSSATGTVSNINFTGLTQDVTVGIEATDANGLGTVLWSTVVHPPNCNTVSTQLPTLDDLEVSPNPTGGVVHVRYSKYIDAVAAQRGTASFNASLFVENPYGGTVFSWIDRPVGSLPTTIDLSNQLPGVYNIRVVSNGIAAKANVVKY